MKIQPNSSNEAELCAIVNALQSAIKSGKVSNDDIVLLQCDNLHAMMVISGRIQPRTELEFDALHIIKEYSIDLNLTIRTRHVKGHTAGLDNRTKANNHCDDRAYKGMQIARAAARKVSKASPQSQE